MNEKNRGLAGFEPTISSSGGIRYIQLSHKPAFSFENKINMYENKFII